MPSLEKERVYVKRNEQIGLLREQIDAQKRKARRKLSTGSLEELAEIPLHLARHVTRFKWSLGNTKYAGYGVIAFSMPPVLTCPNAALCLKYCLARSNQFLGVQKIKYMAWNAALVELALEKGGAAYLAKMLAADLRWIIAHKDGPAFVRIHDSGDFWSTEHPDYADAWALTARAMPELGVFAYTKDYNEVARSLIGREPPDNLAIIRSVGAKAPCKKKRLPPQLVASWPLCPILIKEDLAAYEAAHPGSIILSGPGAEIEYYKRWRAGERNIQVHLSERPYVGGVEVSVMEALLLALGAGWLLFRWWRARQEGLEA